MSDPQSNRSSRALTEPRFLDERAAHWAETTPDEGDKNMVSMPLFHAGGSSYVQFGIHDGVPSVMTREVDGMSLARAILKGANRTFLVPRCWPRCWSPVKTRSSCSAR